MNLIYYGVIKIENLSITRKIFYNRKKDITSIFLFYMWDYKDDPIGTSNNIRRSILKMLEKDIRMEKLKKIEKLFFNISI